ncbi:IS3 family transposase [Iodobacter ciconiae]|uniref:IS3 family transposase n=1 Tax=Iodobacter ciconiae TaxID=2496266 RepID=A0A3S8ZVV7_9NEIS|nr:IS3 family transposase [Iodobacter ciconiae]AZN37612.1 IS3 family transposase [Iodobacter ciconiae]
MSKYTTQFKLSVVQQYLTGEAGIKTITNQYGIEQAMFRRWVRSFRQHGESGLAPKYSHYDAVFKLSVLQHMWDNHLSQQETTAYFDIRSPTCLSQWSTQYCAGGIAALEPAPKGRKKSPMPVAENNTAPLPIDDETRSREELIAEVKRLRLEVAYIKKYNALVQAKAQSAQQKAQIVLELRPQFPLADLLKQAELPRSTFYYQKQALAVSDKYQNVKTQLTALFAEHKGRYGYRRIMLALRNKGEWLNHKTVQRLMQELGLKSCVRPKKYRSYKGECGKIAPNILQRQFSADKPNQKWVTDVTEFNVQGEKLYLSPVLDLYNGEIIAFEMARRPVFALVSQMLKKAIVKLSPDEKPLLHSDQGWQYQMAKYRQQLAGKGLVQSMSRKGNCHDNATMESFFGTLKSEFFYQEKFTSIEQLEQGIVDYIHYYNHDRIKLKLKGLSPVQYRTQPLST